MKSLDVDVGGCLQLRCLTATITSLESDEWFFVVGAGSRARIPSHYCSLPEQKDLMLRDQLLLYCACPLLRIDLPSLFVYLSQSNVTFILTVFKNRDKSLLSRSPLPRKSLCNHAISIFTIRRAAMIKVTLRRIGQFMRMTHIKFRWIQSL